MVNEEELFKYLELQREYRERFPGKEFYQLFPRFWFKMKDYDKLSEYLEEALEKNVLLFDLESIQQLESEDLNRRLEETIAESLRIQDEKNHKI